MTQKYTPDEIFEAMRRADKAGDAEAVKALAAQLDAIDDGVLRGTVTDDSPAPADDAATMVDKSIANTAIGYASGAAKAVVDFPLTIGAVPQVAMNSLLGGARALYNDVTGDPTEAAQVRAQTEQMNQEAWQRATPVANVVNALAPPPKGYETQRDVAEFAGSFLVPGPKGAKAPIRMPSPAAPARAVPGMIDNAAAVVAEGKARNVPVMTTDVKPPKSAMGRWTKQTLPEKIPFFGTSGPRQSQQEERVRVVGDVLREFGGNPAKEMFDNSASAIDEIAKTLGQERTRKITTLKAAKDGVIDAVPDPAPIPKMMQALDQQIARMVSRDTPASREVVKELQDIKAELQKPRTLRGLEDYRADELSKAFDKPDTIAAVKTVGEKALREIYDPMRQDMGDFIQATQGASARKKWSKSNEQLSAMAGELTSARFKNVLRNVDTTPEAVGNILFNSPDNVSDMTRLVSNLPPAGKKKVQAALLQRAFDNAGGPEGVSVERFLSNIDSLSKKIGVAFEGADRQALEGVSRLLDATRRGAAAGANVRTGEQNLPAIMGIGVTQALGLGGGVASLGVGGLVARLYESPIMRDRLLRLASTKAGSPQESRLLEVIMRSATPIVNEWRQNAGNAINDNAAGALAAEGQDTQVNQQPLAPPA